ncbi:hypothetical protein BKA70DRAFT_1215831 [Coprinopsis sp. MPI-PUGE-AT-0042]|nr:hypothetical protein BKA70DRAFT_1215831 [Coprinopsis sp. MPI-PUGE-AT-0042]
MDADDVFAAMGIAGFGKATAKRELDPNRFDKTKRDTKKTKSSTSGNENVEQGSSSKSQTRASAEDDSEPGPQPLDNKQGQGASSSVAFVEPEYDPSEDDADEDDDDDDSPLFPTTHEILLKDHTKVVSAVALDPSGARIVTGSHDYDSECKPFKSWEPAGSYHFLVIPGTLQPRIYDRDGEEKAVFIKGDPYLRDMRHTAGHVAEVMSCAWHPKDPKTFITASADSTIRIWDAEDKRKQKTVIVVKSKDRGGRTKVSACGYSNDGNYIGGACVDGALHMWETNSNFARPRMTIEKAHVKGTETGSLVFSVDGRTVLTRGGPGDETVKLWDLRSFRKPLAVQEGLPALYPRTNAVFSPDDKYILTGSGSRGQGQSPELLFMQKDDLEVVKRLSVASTPVRVAWHSKINQIITGLSSGQVVVLYSPETSLNGAKLVMSKGPRKKLHAEDLSDALSAPTILTPHALPMFRDMDPGRGTKRKREKDRMDPRKSRRPELPVTGPGKGGRVGASATQHLVQHLVRDTTRDVDPREALLKYAEAGEKDPQWTAAWKVNQPKPVFAEEREEKEEDDLIAAINSDKPSELVVAPDVNGLNGNGNALSPAADSPATPVSSVPAPDVKIDLDYPEQESDVRNEPMDVKPIDPYDAPAIDISTQNTTPSPPTPHQLHDDAMDHNGDVTMHDDVAAPPPLTADTSMAGTDHNSPMAYTPRERPGSAEEEDGQPPAKRPRILSDADKSSLTHSATPPPASAAASHATSPVPPPPTTADTAMASSSTTPTRSYGSSSITNSQFKYCQSSLRSLKKLKDSIPFLKPVDPVALNIPHYPTIIKNPMDFSTVERKLNASNPAKPDPNPQNPRYMTVDEFAADVRLIFNNCLTFNGPDHVVSQMGKRVEEVFDRQMKGMPTVEAKPAPPPKKATPPPPPPPVSAPIKKQAPPVRRPSTATAPPVRRNEPEPPARPKREIHAPAPRDLPYASDAPKKNRKPKRLDDGVAEQMKFCGKILNDLFKKQYAAMAHPFYEPVDWVKLELPSYPKIVKRPMDLSTMKKKLDNGDYPNPQKFLEDFKLMIRNCMAFNPSGTPVCTAGQQLQKLFDEKWRGLPPLRPPPVSEDEDEDEEDEDSDAERQRAITLLEQQIETMKGNLEALKSAHRNKERKKKQQKAKEREPLPPPPPPPRAAPKPQPKASTSTTKKKSSSTAKKPIPDDDVLTFEQKKDLSETIGKLEGAKLEKVINIIHEGVPEIRDSTEEIELEIDLLPAAVLTKLYNFVIRPLKQPPVKRNRTGKGTGTGGLKRKSMDEDVEAEKIRQLEQRMALFEQGAGASVSAPPQMHQAGESDSDSSSGSDSSGSDSE